MEKNVNMHYLYFFVEYKNNPNCELELTSETWILIYGRVRICYRIVYYNQSIDCNIVLK